MKGSMKYVIIRCEDEARAGAQTAALLEGAKTAHLQELAHAGAAGLIRRQSNAPAIDRLALHRAAFGLGPDDHEAAPAQCYAASTDVRPGAGETVWCCELMTQRDGRVVDPTAGNIPTKESEVLLRALNQQLGSETRRWSLGYNSHHLLITRDPALTEDREAPLRSPELLAGEPWKRHLPKRSVGEALARLIEQAAALLEEHPVNRVRVDLGENPANLLWLWGMSDGAPAKPFKERTGRSGAIISSHFPMKGFAAAIGLTWHEGPASLAEGGLRRLLTTLQQTVKHHEVTYAHLRIQSADPVERLCIMERIDQILIPSMTETLPALGPWRLAVIVDDGATGTVPVIAIGSGLPQQPVAHLDAQSLAESPLAFDDGVGLFSWLMKQ